MYVPYTWYYTYIIFNLLYVVNCNCVLLLLRFKYCGRDKKKNGGSLKLFFRKILKKNISTHKCRMLDYSSTVLYIQRIRLLINSTRVYIHRL